MLLEAEKHINEIIEKEANNDISFEDLEIASTKYGLR